METRKRLKLFRDKFIDYLKLKLSDKYSFESADEVKIGFGGATIQMEQNSEEYKKLTDRYNLG